MEKLDKFFTDHGDYAYDRGYADAYVDHTIKNSYIILTETGCIVVRHDCYFRHFTPFPSLLNAEVENRHPT
jgi:hypothetical protein